ncbi:MAG: dihydroxyacetone kinase phosphoryl donor subunit DhaM [Bacillota bacterium]
MVGIVVVSHSAKAAEGIVEIAEKMATKSQKIIAAGGVEGGGLGTSVEIIKKAIVAAEEGDGVVILVDLGSAAMCAESALAELGEQYINKVRVANAPVLEGATAAAVQASLGAELAEVLEVAEEARGMNKLIMSKVFSNDI